MDAAEIKRAAQILQNGGLVAFPTETVYGLGANALDSKAVDRIFQVKGRPPTSPLIVHVDSIATVRQVVSEWPDSADKLAREFWPGPLTLVLQKLPIVPDRVTAGLATVGVRVPGNPVALELLKAVKLPIAAPSANRFTQVSPTTADHVRDSLGETVDLILDGGPCQIGIESTVLSLADTPTLLRLGMISQEQIERAIGSIARTTHHPEDAPQPSPGLHPRHYSPATPLRLTTEPPHSKAAYIWYKKVKETERSVQLPENPAAYAQRIYGVLRELDREGWQLIAVEPVPDKPEWAAIADRLERAAIRD